MVSDRFRWVYCQLDNLRRCMPSSSRKALDELPVTLDETYERILQGIPKQKLHHARRLFQCMVAAIRPLRVEELAEIFAIDFGPDVEASLIEDWRPANPDEAVLSTCSTLIAIIEDQGSKIVQFSHFSVKEFLTSDRLQLSDVGNIREFYVPLEPAHTILALACLSVLLQLDINVDKSTFPLAFYAAQHWFDHAKFEEVASGIQAPMERLFNPKKPFFRAWICLQGVLRRNQTLDHLIRYSPSPRETPLYYAVVHDFSRLAEHLIVTHGQDVNVSHDFMRRGLLHVASLYGNFQAAHVLLDHGARVNTRDLRRWTPLHSASHRGHAKIVQLLLEHGGYLNAQAQFRQTALFLASRSGHLEVVRLLLVRGADMKIKGERDLLPSQVAARHRHHDIVQLLLEHGSERE